MGQVSKKQELLCMQLGTFLLVEISSGVGLPEVSLLW